MKKFIITLLILLILGGTAFFFGWAQFMVPPGQYGVVISKTHGIDPDLIRSGEFRWIWYKLIPANVKIAVFNPAHVKYPINYNSALPSGDTYASFVGITNVDFSWNLRGDISFKVNPDSLVSLSKSQNLTSQDDLNSYLQSVSQEMEILIISELSSAGTERLEQLMSGKNDVQIEQLVKSRFPEIQDFSLIINSARFPDFILYRQIRGLYEDFLSRQREVISSAFGRRAEIHIENQLRFEELERYGDLLTRYPVLLEYLTLENHIGGN